MAQQKYLIVGASGQVGSEIVRLLKSQSHAVRTATSRPLSVQKEGESVRLNVITGEGVRDAFAGITRAFVLAPPGEADHYALLSPLIQEAKRRGLEKVVLMTAMGANANEAAPFRRAEVELEKSGLRYNIIRPNWFLQNFSTLWLNGIRDQGKILVPGGQAKVSFIDVLDIAAVAARLLVDDQYANRDFDLTGPEAIDHHRVAAAISHVSGRRITYEEIKPEALLASLVQAGLNLPYAEFILMIFGFLREGYNAGVTSNVPLILGRAARPVETYARENQSAWAAWV